MDILAKITVRNFIKKIIPREAGKIYFNFNFSKNEGTALVRGELLSFEASEKEKKLVAKLPFSYLSGFWDAENGLGTIILDEKKIEI